MNFNHIDQKSTEQTLFKLDLSKTLDSPPHELKTRMLIEKENETGKFQEFTQKFKVLRDCWMSPTDQRFAICKTLFSFGEKQSLEFEKIFMDQQILKNNLLAQDAPQFTGLPICETDPMDESFLICTKKVPLQGLVPERIYKIEKLEYFRTITLRNLINQTVFNLQASKIVNYWLNINDFRLRKLLLGKVQLTSNTHVLFPDPKPQTEIDQSMINVSLEKDEDFTEKEVFSIFYTQESPQSLIIFIHTERNLIFIDLAFIIINFQTKCLSLCIFYKFSTGQIFDDYAVEIAFLIQN